MKILIIRFSSIGDIVWTSPVVRCCKMQLPNAEIHFCTKLQFKTLVDQNPYIDKVHYLEDSLSALVSTLKKEKFDYVIDLHGKMRSIYIALQLGRKTFTYNKLTFQRFLYTKFQLDIMPKNKHLVDRYMDTVKHINVENDEKGLDFFISTENEFDISNLPSHFQEGYASFVIGASQYTKKLPVYKMAELCNTIKKPIVLVGGKEDFEKGEELKKFINSSDKYQHSSIEIFNASGMYNIGQSASIVKKSVVVYGHDTGLTHIAAAFGKKIYSIWGPTSSKGFEPYLANNIILENKNLDCRPCSKSGRSTCPKVHFKCMKEMNFDT